MILPLRKIIPSQHVLIFVAMIGVIIFSSGCAALFGWDIHAPGILSQNFSFNIQPTQSRVGLYLEPSVWKYLSKNRGGRFADPQTYHVGEAYVPMVIEGFQGGFEEFIFFETEPTPELAKQYAVPYVVIVRIEDFGNKVTMKGQAVQIRTQTAVLDPQFNVMGRFISTGSSDAEKIFAKKGGPEVNLNAAIENNVIAMVQYIQDSIRTGNWNR